MINLRITILSSITTVLFLILIEGCSSSTNSIRYNERGKDDNSNSNPVRYSSEDSTNYRPNPLYDNGREFSDNEDDFDSSDTKSIIAPSAILSRFGNEDDTAYNESRDLSVKDKMLTEIIKYLNTPYKYGGETKSGIDCSAFTQTLYSDILSVPLLRTAREQFTEGTEVRSERDLKFGDLVFFNTRRAVKPGHVGIYIGDGMFVHASSSFGVIVSSLNDAYYGSRYMGARRIENFTSQSGF